MPRSSVPARQVVTTRWEEKWKGEEVRSRFVARDYKWREPDRTDLFAATPSDVGLALLLSIASALRLCVQTLDLVTAFIHADIQEPVFVEPPVGYEDSQNVWRLKKAMNGVRSAPLAFQDFLVEVLSNRVKMLRSLADPMVFYHADKPLYVDIHVDDPIAFGSETDLAAFYKELEVHVCVKVEPVVQVGGCFRYLGRSYTRTEKGFIRRPGATYIQDTLELAGMPDCSSAVTPGSSTPSAAELQGKDELLTGQDLWLYPQVVGRLQFLAGDRADIQFACKECARDLAAPTASSLLKLKRLLRYLAGTQRMVQKIELDEIPRYLDCFADSNWANCVATRKSTSGLHLRFGNVLIKAFSRTQSTIALSSGEAEFIALSSAAIEGIWTKNFLKELGYDIQVRVWSDSKAAIGMASRIGPGRVKHLDLKSMFVQKLIKEKVVSIHKVLTDDNYSDLGTKYLPLPRHQLLLRMSGMYEEDDDKSIGQVCCVTDMVDTALVVLDRYPMLTVCFFILI